VGGLIKGKEVAFRSLVDKVRDKDAIMCGFTNWNQMHTNLCFGAAQEEIQRQVEWGKISTLVFMEKVFQKKGNATAHNDNMKLTSKKYS